MEQLSKVALKSQFEETFPEYAKRMESAKNPEEAESIYQEIVGECYKKVSSTLQLPRPSIFEGIRGSSFVSFSCIIVL